MLDRPANRQPHRVQLRRTKGWRMPPDTVKVDRSTIWGNPFVVGRDGGVGLILVIVLILVLLKYI
jgi:hypothetical protein